MGLWRAYDRLCQVVLRAEAVFSTLQLSRDRCPEQLELVVVFEQANAGRRIAIVRPACPTL